jgi:hypothetical protein
MIGKREFRWTAELIGNGVQSKKQWPGDHIPQQIQRMHDNYLQKILPTRKKQAFAK